MSECKDERIGVGGNPGQPSFKIPLSSIKSIIKMLKCAFEVPEIPLPPMSAQEIGLGMQNRPGISKQDVVARVLGKKSKAGLPVGPNNDGSQNLSNVHDRILVEEIMDELMYKGKVEIEIPPGGLTLVSGKDGALNAGQISVTGSLVNSNYFKGEGIIR